MSRKHWYCRIEQCSRFGGKSETSLRNCSNSVAESDIIRDGTAVPGPESLLSMMRTVRLSSNWASASAGRVVSGQISSRSEMIRCKACWTIRQDPALLIWLPVLTRLVSRKSTLVTGFAPFSFSFPLSSPLPTPFAGFLPLPPLPRPFDFGSSGSGLGSGIPQANSTGRSLITYQTNQTADKHTLRQNWLRTHDSYL